MYLWRFLTFVLLIAMESSIPASAKIGDAFDQELSWIRSLTISGAPLQVVANGTVIQGKATLSNGLQFAIEAEANTPRGNISEERLFLNWPEDVKSTVKRAVLTQIVGQLYGLDTARVVKGAKFSHVGGPMNYYDRYVAPDNSVYDIECLDCPDHLVFKLYRLH